MKKKSLILLFALAMVLSMTAGVLAQDFSQTWDEATVLTVFNDLGMYFPDMFADEDSDFLWADDGFGSFEKDFPTVSKGLEEEVAAKAAIAASPVALSASYDPCGDGMIEYDVVITRDDNWKNHGYSGPENVTYVRDINAYLTFNGSDIYKLDLKKCRSTGGDECHSVTFKKSGTVYQAHLKGFLTVPKGIVLTKANSYELQMFIDFSTYMTALWPVETPGKDSATVLASATVNPNTKKEYCQDSLEPYNGLSGASVRAKYDENTGEARLQAVIRNYQPDVTKRNYVIPGEVFAYNGPVTSSVTYPTYPGSTSVSYTDYVESQRVTDYKCEYTVYNTKNAAPRTDYCKFGEGIAIPDHGMLRIDITIDHLSGAVVRKADGNDIPFALRLGGMIGGSKEITGKFEPVEFPCPPVTRMLVMDPLRPFMSFYKMDADDPISPSGAYNTYEGGLWGMYQKCGKYAYMAVRLKNDGVKEEVIDLNHAAVSINGGSPITWAWVMTTISADWNNRIYLDGGEDVILIGRAKVTDYPYQLNADNAMSGAVNFTDYGLYITGKVYSDHNNTRCY